jgi:hypothetical protein
MSGSTIKLNRSEWNKIRTRLKSEYPPSWTLLRETMRRELGFTPRDYQGYDQLHHVYIDEVHLDFFDEGKEAFFRLKYL